MAANTTRKPFSFKPDENSDESKSGVLEIDWTGMSLEATRALAAKDIVIRNAGKMRKTWASFKAGEVVKVKAVNFTTGDPMALLKSMKPEERRAFLESEGLI